MNKPITVVRHDFINALTALINDSQLPPFILEPILKDFYADIHVIAQQQLENDMKQYMAEKTANKELDQ